MAYNDKEQINTYFKYKYKQSLNGFILAYSQQINFDPAFSFMGSWMLSSLVRYEPATWRNILAGEKSDIIVNIRNFREHYIPEALMEMLTKINIDYYRNPLNSFS